MPNNKPKPDGGGGFPYPPPAIPSDNNGNSGRPNPIPDLINNPDQNRPKPDNGGSKPPLIVPDTNQGGYPKPSNGNNQSNQADPIDSSTYIYDIDVRFGEESADASVPKPAAKA